MTLHTVYLIVVALFLTFAALAYRRWGIKRFPLIVYVIAVAVVWAVILSVMWFLGDIALFEKVAMVCAGYVLGMVAMYIAMHVYKS